MRGAHGRELLKSRIRCGSIGIADRSGQAVRPYEVRVRLPGEAQARVFTDLPCAPGFKALGGSASAAAVRSVRVEIDNLVLTLLVRGRKGMFHETQSVCGDG
jgi:hypothetical protein